jgi:hypothetical protein
LRRDHRHCCSGRRGRLRAAERRYESFLREHRAGRQTRDKQRPNGALDPDPRHHRLRLQIPVSTPYLTLSGKSRA